jgi:Fanconi anemia group M protein
MAPEAKHPKIAVDSREPDEICDYLEALGAELGISQLELGDYQASDRLIVERKTRQDFESSIVDGRLWQQLSELTGGGKEGEGGGDSQAGAGSQPRGRRVVLVVEGTEGEQRLSREALLGAYAAALSDFGCALFFTRSPQATADLVFHLACHEQLSKKQPLSVYAKRKARTFAEQQLAVAEALPNVGPKLARSLLEYFDTLENIATAPESELKEVGKIGEKKAKELREIFTKRYKNDEKTH